MYEGYVHTAGAAAGLLVYHNRALFLNFGNHGIDIIDANSQMLNALSVLINVAGNRAVGGGCCNSSSKVSPQGTKTVLAFCSSTVSSPVQERPKTSV
jgi:hypothetical protein